MCAIWMCEYYMMGFSDDRYLMLEYKDDENKTFSGVLEIQF